MSALFEPFKLKDVTLRNRIAIPPMCQYMADDGMVNDWHHVHLAGMARGGAGLLVVEATAVAPEGRITPGCAGIWSDAHAQAFVPMVKAIKAAGSVPGIQIAHAGRKASANRPWEGDDHIPASDARSWETIAPSAIAFGANLPNVPRAMTLEDIARVQQDFVDAARRARDAGFDLVELHSAHGYLLHQFLSPSSNHRTDQYGGSVENRARLVLEVVDAASKEWSADRIGIRVSPIGSFQNVDNGPNEEADALYLIEALAKRGIAYLHMSEPDWAGGQPYSDEFRQKVRDRFPGAIIGAGAYTVEKANDLIGKGLIDAVAFGRDYIANPDLVARLQKKAALNPQRPESFYGGGAEGYTDYPTL